MEQFLDSFDVGRVGFQDGGRTNVKNCVSLKLLKLRPKIQRLFLCFQSQNILWNH